MKVFCISQARMGSTRLPGKVLKTIQDKALLTWHCERIAQSQTIDQHIIATTTQTCDEDIVKLCQQKKWHYYQGSELNVLERFYQTALAFNAQPSDLIIRVTSDCPLIDAKLIDELVQLHITENLTGISNIAINQYPRGFDAEIFSMSALTDMMLQNTTPYQQEHVTPYLYDNPEQYPLAQLGLKNNNSAADLRLCVDEENDFLFIKTLIANFPGKILMANALSIINFLQKSPDIVKINQDVKQK